MHSKVTYHQQVSYCGKPRCRKCREGKGHGPYWYAYKTEGGRTTRTYIGKELPPAARAEMEGVPSSPTIQSSEFEHTAIRIYVLGQFRLERRSRADWLTVTDSAWQHQRVRALLGCLVSSTGRKLGREQIMYALWPDADTETAASRLDRAVYSLRQLFEPGRSRLAASLLSTEREVLVLAEQEQLWIDADAFERLLTRAHASDDPGEKERLLEEAAMLYGGPFLPEERKIEWTLARRESLQRSWIGLLLELSDLRIDRQAAKDAIEPLDRLLAIDPTNEAAVQRLMLLMAQLGRRGEALRAYKRLAMVLKEEYRIAPLPETRALYDAVRSGSPGNVNKAMALAQAASVGGERRIEPQAMHVPVALQIGRSNQTPLVGREEELELLRALLEETEQIAHFKLLGHKKSTSLLFDTQHRPQSMLLMGDVGIGKTRLAEEISREAKQKGWTVAWSRVYAQEGSIAYRLWTEILRKAMAQGTRHLQEISKHPQVFQPLSVLLPELHDYFPQNSYSHEFSPEREQLLLWEAALKLLVLVSEGAPLLIALDDLQWADSSSCELLAYLARRVHGHPIVIVGTCRDNEIAPEHVLRGLLTDLQREHAVETISLAPLTDEQIATLISHILPTVKVPTIRERAAGNPFFAEELARTVDAQAQLNGHNGSSSELAQNLPDTITAVLDLRLERLSAACRRLLSKAAVLGGPFRFQIINEMEAMTPGSDEDLVLELLEEALHSGMLTEEGTGSRVTYHFWHPLLINHLYEGLSAARRASLHRRAADILRRFCQGHEEEEASAAITTHLVRGGGDEQLIIRYAEMAGNHSYSLSSYTEAEKYYRIALEYLEANISARADVEVQLRRADLLEVLGDCTRIQGKYEVARKFFEESLNAHRKRAQKNGRDLVQEAQLQAMLLCEIGRAWYDTNNHAKALECYLQSEQMLLEAGVEKGPVWATIRLRQSYVYWREGNYDEAHNKVQQSLELFQQSLDAQKIPIEKNTRLTRIRRTLLGDSVDLGRMNVLLGAIEVCYGHGREALKYYTAALALFEQHECLREIAITCCDLGDIYLRQAEYSRAQAALRRSLNLAERIGDIPLMSFVYGNIGMLDIRLGNLEDAELGFRNSITTAERIDNSASASLWYACLAIVLREQGKLSDTIKPFCKALTIGRARHLDPYVGFALIALGNLRIAQALEVNHDKREHGNKEMAHMLTRARSALRRALALGESTLR
ncbi:tetratricopeptide repeat protein [Ktedonosporobacter rubrisoli]|uniref:Tetratricopeptide repeat protein n=1 Tax=Ktedonosporobacter rubrisoli TaxID=2509675 RepID=A0A4P6K5H8_KTERU|nr:DUF6788 family protein [Ktedonosporobacter rubrisoli]QBD83130.1 tetratricopeptide repeat protein [Ktedonosporobacter rubrisoli]